MGNTAPNDGFFYRGRGGSQTTGREGYAKLARLTGLDVLKQPDLVNDPRYFMECAVADFIACGCLPYAQRNDIVGVTRRLNGGYIGLNERKTWFAKWQAALNIVPQPTVILPPTQVPIDLPDIHEPPYHTPQPWWAALLDFIIKLFKGK
jgi:putative chitinase